MEHVSLTIGTAQILRDISVQFEKGQIHGIVRRNGSGKAQSIFKINSSTLLAQVSKSLRLTAPSPMASSTRSG